MYLARNIPFSRGGQPRLRIIRFTGIHLLCFDYLKQRCGLTYAGELDAKCLNFDKQILGRRSDNKHRSDKTRGKRGSGGKVGYD